MQDFYFQVLIIVFATMITGFIGWMAFNTWRMTTKVAAFEKEIITITADLTSIAEDVKTLRRYDAQIAVLNAESANIKADVAAIFGRMRDLEKAA